MLQLLFVRLTLHIYMANFFLWKGDTAQDFYFKGLFHLTSSHREHFPKICIDECKDKWMKNYFIYWRNDSVVLHFTITVMYYFDHQIRQKQRYFIRHFTSYISKRGRCRTNLCNTKYQNSTKFFILNLKAMSQCDAACPVSVSSLRRLKQEDCHELEASLGCPVSSRLTLHCLNKQSKLARLV